MGKEQRKKGGEGKEREKRRKERGDNMRINEE